ncbi:hypothetical protein B4U80_13473 [Leptotrombidium deliense]|uniref:Uncharacterized protein n=1 Tax=Leptotrombidium deliense TaxID=299467 RepID=A0A443S5S1_9ACAR|nr:hypothetical protein B4U80_13473 [Leptotrombidium deliense]
MKIFLLLLLVFFGAANASSKQCPADSEADRFWKKEFDHFLLSMIWFPSAGVHFVADRRIVYAWPEKWVVHALMPFSVDVEKIERLKEVSSWAPRVMMNLEEMEEGKRIEVINDTTRNKILGECPEMKEVWPTVEENQNTFMTRVWNSFGRTVKQKPMEQPMNTPSKYFCMVARKVKLLKISEKLTNLKLKPTNAGPINLTEFVGLVENAFGTPVEIDVKSTLHPRKTVLYEVRLFLDMNLEIITGQTELEKTELSQAYFPKSDFKTFTYYTVSFTWNELKYKAASGVPLNRNHWNNRFMALTLEVVHHTIRETLRQMHPMNKHPTELMTWFDKWNAPHNKGIKLTVAQINEIYLDWGILFVALKSHPQIQSFETYAKKAIEMFQKTRDRSKLDDKLKSKAGYTTDAVKASLKATWKWQPILICGTVDRVYSLMQIHFCYDFKDQPVDCETKFTNCKNKFNL